jgi:hypothetical protein
MASQFVSLNKFFRINPTNEVSPEWLNAVATKNMSAIVSLVYKRFEAFVEEVNYIDNDCEQARAALRDIRRNEERVANEERKERALIKLRDVERDTKNRNFVRREEAEFAKLRREEERVANESRASRALQQLRYVESDTKIRNVGREARRKVEAESARFWAEYDAAPPDRREHLLDEYTSLQGGKKPRSRRSPRRRSRK